jgi:tRNA-dihydrouridine synthase 4
MKERRRSLAEDARAVDDAEHEEEDSSSSKSPNINVYPSSSSSRSSHSNLHRRLPDSPTPPSPNHVLTRGLLIAQFASPDGKSLADAVELISSLREDDEGDFGVEGGRRRLIDGIDLNCVSPACLIARFHLPRLRPNG